MIGCNRLQRVALWAFGSVVFLWLCVRIFGRSEARARWPSWIPEDETPWSMPPDKLLGSSSDPARKQAVVRAFKHAWKGYERDAFGCDEYHPVSRTGKNLTTERGIGYMIVDALDTMLIMGQPLQEEYRRARNWVATELDFDRDGRYSTFEITIRILGGLLSAYALSGKDELYLRRAQELADRLLPAFNTPHGLPIPNVNFHNEPKTDWHGEPVSTAEAATLQLEFRYLAHITGKNVYWETAERVMHVIRGALKGENVVDGALAPIDMRCELNNSFGNRMLTNPRSHFLNKCADRRVYFWVQGDTASHQIDRKQYLQTNRTEKVYKEMYDQAMAAVHKHMVFRTPLNGLTYIAELEPTWSSRIHEKWRASPKQDHLVCFLGGSLMLGVTEGRSLNRKEIENLSKEEQRDWKLGEELTRTCMDTHKTKTGLSPEIAMFCTPDSPQSKTKDWYPKNQYDSRYILRPETVESLFLGWRMTRDPKYRKWGWKIFEAIEKHCKVPGGGYSGVLSVAEVPVQLLDNMETFFPAETLKYLYLLFDDSTTIPLDGGSRSFYVQAKGNSQIHVLEFVFNTEPRGGSFVCAFLALTSCCCWSNQIHVMSPNMTTKARPTSKPVPESEEVHVVDGETITCDACNVDLMRNVRIKCAAVGCEELDLCPTCFCAGKEPEKHKAWHDYRVVGRHSYPILVEDWGADEELQLLDGLAKCGMGNWSAVAELIGTRTPEEVEQHYTECYLNSPDWPLPRLEQEFDVDYETFQERRKQRIINLRENLKKKPGPTQSFVSGPTNHEVGGFMPGRREFEHEYENDAEDLVKDLEFGIVLEYGGDQQPEDEEKPEESGAMEVDVEVKVEGDGEKNADPDEEEPQPPAVVESTDSMQLKLSLLDMYNERLDARIEAKAIVLERGLTDHKRIQQAERKRSKEDREFINKLKPFARLQTADDFENLVAGLLYENTLKRRISELQHYRTMGITTFAEAEKYDRERLARSQQERARADRLMGPTRNGHRSSVPPGGESGQSRLKEESSLPKSGVASRRPAPLNLANAQSLHLLTPAEQTLCAALRILPVHFLGIKETLVRECVRRGGRLRRREARELVRIDVHKTGQIWDLLVRTGVLKLAPEVAPAMDTTAAPPDNSAGGNSTNPWTSLPASSLAPGQGA
ncbi:Transcriptional adapter 2 [Ceratobasidium theobromae]|uniref:alpha-1,2-Mannosidase n=1 Tax=Ceratobasidium theobromae TaxID=1582974 RepID=A0A5N5QIE7_9AGAM|nr:Transcriptional adapter 2 [Ceratobasidium theobromae]